MRSVNDVVETLKSARDRGRGCSLLIGAGCSEKAGIPTAAGFVEVIRNGYPCAYDRAKKKTYPQCMAQLAYDEQRDLIGQYIDRAKINWAHVGIASLMKAGYVDRVLTTNFDPLIARACALIGLFPAIYDFASSQYYAPKKIRDQAVIYLHGQRSGFVLMNEGNDLEDHSKLMKPVFQDAGRGRVWIVVGYSGENDPVFNHLAQVSRFDNNLYWVGYNDSEPAVHVRRELLEGDKDAFYIKGFDADSFFVTLAQRLKCFPPDLIRDPFAYLDDVLNTLIPYTPPGEKEALDIVEATRRRLRRAKEMYDHAAEEPDLVAKGVVSSPDIEEAWANLMAGSYQKVLNSWLKSKDASMAEVAAWARTLEGNALLAQARTETGEEADRLFALAGEKYQAALAIKPDKHEALNNWGNALSAQGTIKGPQNCSPFLAKAREVLLRADAIQPGSSAYNLACLSALENKEEECRKWLNESRRAGKLPASKHLLEDPDLDSVRSRDWFRALLESVRRKN